MDSHLSPHFSRRRLDSGTFSTRPTRATCFDLWPAWDRGRQTPWHSCLSLTALCLIPSLLHSAAQACSHPNAHAQTSIESKSEGQSDGCLQCFLLEALPLDVQDGAASSANFFHLLLFRPNRPLEHARPATCVWIFLSSDMTATRKLRRPSDGFAHSQDICGRTWHQLPLCR